MTDQLTHLPYDLPGTIYRSPMPSSPLFDPEGKLLSTYEAAGVDVVLMLTPDAEARRLTGHNLRALYQARGFDVIHTPVPDFSAPSSQDLQHAISRVLEASREGKTIVAHCHAGIGRTGTFLACLAKVVFNKSGEEAIDWVRQYVPHAVENQQQYRFVLNFDFSAGRD